MVFYLIIFGGKYLETVIRMCLEFKETRRQRFAPLGNRTVYGCRETNWHQPYYQLFVPPYDHRQWSKGCTLKFRHCRSPPESPFKIQKNGVFLFEISFFFLEISRFSIMQICSVMTSYCLQLKCGKYWINSFCQKAKIPICNLYGGTKGSTWNRNSSHIVLNPIIRLGGVDSSCFKAKLGITVFINTAPAAKLLSW